MYNRVINSFLFGPRFTITSSKKKFCTNLQNCLRLFHSDLILHINTWVNVNNHWVYSIYKLKTETKHQHNNNYYIRLTKAVSKFAVLI